MHLDKDRGIFRWCMLCCWDIQNWSNTPVDNLVVLQYRKQHKNTKETHWNLGIVRKDRMEMDYKDHDINLAEVVWQVLIRIRKKIQSWSRAKEVNLTWLRITSRKGIASITIHAITNWTVVVNSAFCVLAASIWTWIDTFLIDASFIITTFRAHNTFRSTARWTSNIIWQARANSLIILFSALRIRTARWGLTRIDVCWCDGYVWTQKVI